MAFLTPAFFLGLLAIGIPILVHLTQKEKKTVIDFPSLKFLRQIPYTSVRRRSIRDKWLLLLRIAALALMVLAFSRPDERVDYWIRLPREPEGYARGLMRVVAERILARGETPFLHVYAHNKGAIALYEQLGFVRRRSVILTVLARGAGKF